MWTVAARRRKRCNIPRWSALQWCDRSTDSHCVRAECGTALDGSWTTDNASTPQLTLRSLPLQLLRLVRLTQMLARRSDSAKERELLQDEWGRWFPDWEGRLVWWKFVVQVRRVRCLPAVWEECRRWDCWCCSSDDHLTREIQTFNLNKFQNIDFRFLFQTYKLHARSIAINVDDRPERYFRVEASKENTLIHIVQCVVHFALLCDVESEHAVHLCNSLRQRLCKKSRSIGQVRACIPEKARS